MMTPGLGSGAGATVTVTFLDTVPLGPVQDSEYVWLAVSAPVFDEPLVDLAPLQAPEAVQLVALVVDQLKFVLAP